MDLLQLQHFLAVVEERTFTRAAERACRTQPAVSQTIWNAGADSGPRAKNSSLGQIIVRLSW